MHRRRLSAILSVVTAVHIRGRSAVRCRTCRGTVHVFICMCRTRCRDILPAGFGAMVGCYIGNSPNKICILWVDRGENDFWQRLNKPSAFAVKLLFNTLYRGFRIMQYVIYFHMSNSKLSAHALKSKILYIINKKYRHLCKGMVQYNCQRER